jgi:hypothetical protein
MYRYSQMFNLVFSCHAADVPSLSDFVPNPMNHVRIYGRKHPCCPRPPFFQTCKKCWNKNFVFNLTPTQKCPGVLYRTNVVAKLSFHHVQSKQPPCDWGGKISKHLCTDGLPSGGLHENVKIRRNFWNVPDQIVTSNSGVKTVDFLVQSVWNVMAHAQKPDLVFQGNGRVHLNQRGSQFSRVLAVEVSASAGSGSNAG